ncbi:hypothetical protein SBI_08547 [Streptomyces bingchenggensis BCW-1]|uniref:DUF317 domain-containing protein n=1 Tax=Streptomyces bingchenggensis (strain BCW-1) TaxID=749414 RepID=D7BUB6_STRBB|nr:MULTISPECIES: DUF317 domain-containing protein [Streptomyces]ADI11665.1 hypothetical protein SBI_08547 [Streptomyces bingchenggensis BCW-1]
MNDRAAPASYLISPSYLAGPDERSTAVREILLAAGWQTRRDGDKTIYLDPSGMREAWHWSPESGVPMDVTGRLLAGWEFAASTAPGRDAVWVVRFAETTPPEIVAAFAAVLADDTRPDVRGIPAFLLVPTGNREEATAPLAEAGWIFEREEGGSGWLDPNGLAGVVIATDWQQDGVGRRWMFVARPAIGKPSLWSCVAWATTPLSLVATLSRAIVDPTPVPRSALPGPDAGSITVIGPA